MPRKRVLSAGLVVALAASVAFGYLPEPLTYVNHLNYSRKIAGLYQLCTDSQLMEKAQIQADLMASTGNVVHSTNLLADVPAGTRFVAENVGVGWSLITLHVAFLASPPHAANIYSRQLTHIGVGITNVGVSKYIAVIAISNYLYGCNL